MSRESIFGSVLDFYPVARTTSASPEGAIVHTVSSRQFRRSFEDMGAPGSSKEIVSPDIIPYATPSPQFIKSFS